MHLVQLGEFPLAVNAVLLGRLVAPKDLDRPVRGYDPTYTTTPVTSVNQLQAASVIEHASDKRGLAANLTPLFKSSASSETFGATRFTTEKSTSYTLLNSAELFNEAMGQDATRRWVERCLEQSKVNHLFMVVGLQTVTNADQTTARVSTRQGQGAIQSPTSLIPGTNPSVDLSTISGIAIRGEVLAARVVNQQHSGEYISGIEYQKIRGGFFNFSKAAKLDGLILRDNTKWRYGAVHRGGSGGDDLDEEDGICVELAGFESD
ncbi:hypothetical protein QBC33DRAFT_316643 [Phialemonium atrogriseum]|uniref:Uncharacterized protein n=1 Tax=Phialemonium atrogriseum TaxID=1093897 RepID=A0AAJ0BP89_9PEZI|nr:uncharacterized protein QBC33DRAFT_316643 [Phialemonium atrogriseum]KAK1761949.1 hypothetical protein QBC33DRAFT_316643 [Phialemonium atrogriseum]